MSDAASLKVHETTTAQGDLAPVFLRLEGGVLSLAGDDGGLPLPLPDGALDAVLARFGAPVEPSEPLIEVAAMSLGDGRVVRHVRHLAKYDVIARDYLVYEAPDHEPRCALATTVVGALTHLARANAAR